MMMVVVSGDRHGFLEGSRSQREDEGEDESRRNCPLIIIEPPLSLSLSLSLSHSNSPSPLGREGG